MEQNKAYFLEIEQYCESMCAQTSNIGTFVPLSDRDVQNKVNGNNPGPYFILIAYRGGLNENRQRTLSKKTLTFAILLKAPHDDANKQREAINRAEWIGLNIMAKIDLDSINGTPDWMKNAFLKDSVVYDEMQYENFPGLFGMEFSVDLNVKNTLKYNTEFWK